MTRALTTLDANDAPPGEWDPQPSIGAAERKSLIVVGPTPPPYHGVAVMTALLIDSLRDRGLLAGHLETRDPRPVSAMGRLDLTNLWLGLKHAMGLVVLFARQPRAAVYVPISQNRWGFLRDAVFLIAARLAGRPRIVHLHGAYFATFRADSGPLVRGAIRAALGGVDQAWVLTDGLRGVFEDLVPQDRVGVLENAADDPATAGQEPPVRAPSPESLRILYLSNLVPDKGCFELMEALERASDSDALPNLHVRLVGEVTTEVLRRIEERARGLAPRGITVEVSGPRTGAAKHAEYGRADLFVYPTRYRYEGQPLVLLEAMGAGLPIITTSVAGIPETVEDERSALVVPPGDVECLAEGLRRAISDPELRERLGRAARRRYLARYTPQRFDEQIARLLGVEGGEGAPAVGGPARPLGRDAKRHA
jgi:glycosyltransferase involved in cell wall biosynthesis